MLVLGGLAGDLAIYSCHARFQTHNLFIVRAGAGECAARVRILSELGRENCTGIAGTQNCKPMEVTLSRT